jgi:hypothetical protein
VDAEFSDNTELSNDIDSSLSDAYHAHKKQYDGTPMQDNGEFVQTGNHNTGTNEWFLEHYSVRTERVFESVEDIGDLIMELDEYDGYLSSPLIFVLDRLSIVQNIRVLRLERLANKYRDKIIDQNHQN